MLTKISILSQALKRPALLLVVAVAGLLVALYVQHQKLEIEGLKNDELKSRLADCKRANKSADVTIARLQEVQQNAEQQRQEALRKQREMLEQLYAPKDIEITSEDECANSVVPDDIRLRFKPDN